MDAGPIYAAADVDDAHHAECLQLLEQTPGPLLVPVLVVTELAYLLGSRLGPEAEVRFLGSLATGELLVEHVSASDWIRIAELVWTYRYLPLGTVDASLVAAAERLEVVSVATLDRRHLGVVRPRHAPAFDLLP